MALTDKLSAIGDAIRTKTGKEELLTLDSMVTEISSIQTGGGSSLPDGFNVFTLTLTERYTTSAEGWELVIPHGLGVVPSSVIVMRMGVIDNAALYRGWIGNHWGEHEYDIAENIRMSGWNGYNREALSFHDSAAKWLYADDTNLYCRSGGWGGSLEVGCILLVGVMA